MSNPSSGNCYGDGTVYRGERSADSSVETLDYRSLWYAAAKEIELLTTQRDKLLAVLEDIAACYPNSWAADQANQTTAHLKGQT